MSESTGGIISECPGDFVGIRIGWDGGSDPDPNKAEPYDSILVVVLQHAGEIAT